MVLKTEEMADSSLKGGKVGSFSASPQDKGRKNKRKLADPSQQNAPNLPSALTEFPRYELPTMKSRNPLIDYRSIGKVEDSESAGWDDPLACHLEELLSSNLLTVFCNAIKQIVDCGYSEDVAQKAISGSGLYYGGNDLVASIVTDTLNFLNNGKEGAGSRDYVFEDLQHLVAYTLIEMICLIREVRPFLSTVEAMWQLLMCDMNVLKACEVEGDGLGESSCGSTLNKPSEAQTSESKLPKPGDPDTQKPSSISDTKNNQTEPLKFGNFPNLSNFRNPHASGTMAQGKEVFSGGTASGEGIKNGSNSEERSGTGQKGRSKKELTMLRQKSCVEKYRTYGKGANRTAKLASIGGFLVEKRVKLPSDLVALQAKSDSSKITTDVGFNVPLTEASYPLLNNNTSSDLPVIDTKGFVTALPAGDADSATPAQSFSEKKSGPETEVNASASTKATPDYYAGIPYDASLGKYLPQDKKDELILKLVPRIKDLQNELQSWTGWANQKVMQAARRLTKDQPELKALRKEKEEAEQYKKEKQLLEENTMKRLSEMEFALNNASNQLEKANHTVRRLGVEQSLLKKEMEAAKIRAAESAESCRDAKERGQKALKDSQSWDGQKGLLLEELKSQRDKVAEMRQEVARAKNRQNRIEVNQNEATWKQERASKEKLLTMAAAIKKEREQLEAFGKTEEEQVKSKAETDMKYYIDNIKRLETEISKLKLESESSKIAALKRGIDGSYGGNKSGSLANTKGNQTPNLTKGITNVWENMGGAKIKRERECVMCLSEEMTVIFLPCAHQVLCSKCNELHEKEGMKDCPSCRATIQRRIQARFGRG